MTRSVWIEGYEGKYKIYDDGRVQSFCLRRPAFLKPDKNPNGYLYFKISASDNTRKGCRAHCLVAKHFVPGHAEGLQVNHKNGIKTDNRAENLEWVSCQENIRHAHRNGLRKKTPSKIGKKSEEAILPLLSPNKWLSPTEIAKVFGKKHCSWTSVVCSRLVANGLAERSPKGHYRAIK